MLGVAGYPALPTEPGAYSVRSLYRVSEWRGGAVYKTTFIRNLFVPMGCQLATWVEGDQHFMIVSCSTKETEEWLNEGRPVIVRVRNQS